MAFGIEKSFGIYKRRDSLNPLARPSTLGRDGRTFLKKLKECMSDPEAALALQQVRDQVFFQKPKAGAIGRTVGFAGPVGNEGATSMSLLLGMTLGELKRNRVLFIDGRLERKDFAVYTEIFGLQKSSLNGDHEAGSFNYWTNKGQNLTFLVPSASLESLSLFSGEEIEKFVGDLRKVYDYVVFDMPPVLRASETRMLAAHLDLFFLICAADKTLREDIARSSKLIEEAGGSIKGIVLNKQRVPFWASLFGKSAFA